MRRSAVFSVLIVLILAGQLMAQGVITRTPWEMNHGASWSYLGYSLSTHGQAPEAYANASIPDESDPNWGPAPNPDIIGFSEYSQIPNNGNTCLTAVNYTYFQTYVTVPTNAVVTQFSIAFSGIDDGARITIFNDASPEGAVVPGSYVFLGGSGTSNLADYVVAGTNRVVVTQVDDCPTGNNLQVANVVLNGETVQVGCTPSQQTFTILGASGTQGQVDPYTQALPAGATEWQQAYLTGWHPWGFVSGTNSWVNFDPSPFVGLNTSTPYRIRFEVPEDYADPSMVFQMKGDNRVVLWINDTYIGSFDGAASYNVTDLVAEQALHTGLNEIRLTLDDWGGWVGLNYRIDVTMTSCEDISDAVLTPEEAAALNNAPDADAGMDETYDTSSFTLDGSGSSDPDGNLLTYSWSLNGTEVATGVNPSFNLADGTYNFTLTVSDGEATDTDDVTIVVATNAPPVAAAGADQSFPCSTGPVSADLDGSGSFDPDDDALSYSWSYNGQSVSSAASFSTAALADGSHTFILTVSDGEYSASDEVVINVEIDAEAPEILTSGDQSVSNDAGLCGASVDFDFSATDNCELASIEASHASGDFFPVGTTTVTVTATDAAGNSSESFFDITVTDDEAPAFAAISERITLWPPNHQYVSFDVTDFVSSVDDNCSDLASADVQILSVSSDEDENARGNGDGNTNNDIVIDGSSVSLRAERAGNGNGRVYTIYMSVSDEHGNASEATAIVQVPHNRKRDAIDDGMAYSVQGSGSMARFAGAGLEEAVEIALPERYALGQNFPNPFNPSTTISYDIPEAGFVSLTVYDVRGAQVAELVNQYMSAGSHDVTFRANDLVAGTYLYVLETAGQRIVKRMALIK